VNRRAFLQSAPLIGFLGARVGAAQQATSSILEPWKPGALDIHHLAYGRGNSTFVICPDGTTILIDVGTTEDSLKVSSAQKPNANVRPGEWIASYIARHMRAAGRRELDYFLLTHLHPDHAGDLGPENPRSPKGDYRLTGVMDVDAQLRIAKLVDRGFPDYDYPAPQLAPFARNYMDYVKSRVRLGETASAFAPGAKIRCALCGRPDGIPISPSETWGRMARCGRDPAMAHANVSLICGPCEMRIIPRRICAP
jgi:hypothetical protein